MPVLGFDRSVLDVFLQCSKFLQPARLCVPLLNDQCLIRWFDGPWFSKKYNIPLANKNSSAQNLKKWDAPELSESLAALCFATARGGETSSSATLRLYKLYMLKKGDMRPSQKLIVQNHSHDWISVPRIMGRLTCIHHRLPLTRRDRVVLHPAKASTLLWRGSSFLLNYTSYTNYTCFY